MAVDDLKSKLITLERCGSDTDDEDEADEKQKDDDEEEYKVLEKNSKYTLTVNLKWERDLIVALMTDLHNKIIQTSESSDERRQFNEKVFG